MSNERAMFGKQLKKEREEFRRYEKHLVKFVRLQMGTFNSQR
jgi:hypothetical protein